MKRDADDKELLDSVERGEWKFGRGGNREQSRYARYAKATFRRISSFLHTYASGRLKETKEV